MGALTLKPLAYQARPWELTRVDVFNHYDGVGSLVLHLRGSRVMRVSQPTGWMRDRLRFAYDGLRRQRLTAPYVRGEPTNWSVGITLLVTLLGGRRFTFRVDPEGVHFFWLLRGYNLFRDPRGTPRVVSIDSNYEGDLYHGAFGLKGAERSSLTLPGCLTLEEEEVLTSPTGAVAFFLLGCLLPQLLGNPTGGYRWGDLVTPAVDHPRGTQRALFQVSPLQGLLGTEW